MTNFLNQYATWRNQDGENQTGEEFIPAFLEWIEVWELEDITLSRGYGFPAEISYSDQAIRVCIAMNGFTGRINVFPWRDTISPNFMSVTDFSVTSAVSRKVSELYGLSIVIGGDRHE